MKYELNGPNGTVYRGGVAYAQLKAVDECSGEIKFEGMPKELTYRFYGPFGQGYNIGLFHKEAEILTLSYDWREGSSIYLPQFPLGGLGLDNGQILDPKAGSVIGNFSVSGEVVSIELKEEASSMPAAHLVPLLMLKAQWANRIGLFKKTPHGSLKLMTIPTIAAMIPISLNLVVLRSPYMERAAAFYACLGFQFSKHRHGNGPEHFAAEISGGVFEIYPQAEGGPSTLGTRVGFKVPSLDAAIAAVGEYPNAVIAAPKDSEWGRRAVVADPDGHRVELVEG